MDNSIKQILKKIGLWFLDVLKQNLVTVLIILAAWFYLSSYNISFKRLLTDEKEFEELNDSINEYFRLDSLRNEQQKQLYDSLIVKINMLQKENDKLMKISNELDKNEKKIIEKINNLDVSLPDL